MYNYDKFKDEIYTLTGINLSLYKEKQMKRRINSLISRNHIDDYKSYVQFIKKDKEAFNQFINYLTINVSEFFRNKKQWDKVIEKLIPSLLKNNRRLKIWSAACSTGQEPYTLAMILDHYFSLSSVEILAVDIDQEALNQAQVGLYSEKNLKNVPKEILNKYFTKVGNSYQVVDKIKNAVTFKKMNLLEDTYPSNRDLIICRNVMIYFTEEAKSEMFHKFNKALKPHGVLFVGSTEQIIMADRYNFQSRDTFFYEKIKK